MQRVAIFGASGYTGLELLRWLANHRNVSVIAASSDRLAGDAISKHLATGPRDLRFETHEAVMNSIRAGDIALLATPAETSIGLAGKILERGARVIDLSGGFRLALEDYPRWYGFSHPAPELLREAVYGLPELLPISSSARLVANPGCYASAAALSVAPLAAHHLTLEGAPILLDGKSGTTGAGRRSEEPFSYSEVADTVRPYRVLRHQHTPEIERTLGAVSGDRLNVLFTPHLVPMRRGILVTGYARARAGVVQADIDRAFDSLYGGKRFVVVRRDRPPEPGFVAFGNYCEVGAWLDERTSTIVTFGALDNLVKGAAGQAIQNLNVLIGADEATGLGGLF